MGGILIVFVVLMILGVVLPIVLTKFDNHD